MTQSNQSIVITGDQPTASSLDHLARTAILQDLLTRRYNRLTEQRLRTQVGSPDLPRLNADWETAYQASYQAQLAYQTAIENLIHHLKSPGGYQLCRSLAQNVFPDQVDSVQSVEPDGRPTITRELLQELIALELQSLPV